MKKIYILFLYLGILMCIVVTFSSCTSAKSVNLLQDIEPIYPSKPFKDYRLQYSDEVYCNILTSNTDFLNEFNGSLSSGSNNAKSYTIYENGTISIPYFGEIYILGLTIEEAEQVIQKKMQQAFPDAQVKVVLRNNAYFIVSEDKRGRYYLDKDNTTIYQALAMSGRPSSSMDLSKVKIVRTDEYGKSYVRVFDLRAESIIESEFYYVKPNDLIYYSTSTASFFNIGSYQALISTLLLPIGTVLSVISIARLNR